MKTPLPIPLATPPPTKMNFYYEVNLSFDYLCEILVYLAFINR